MNLFLIGTSHKFQKGLNNAPVGCYAEFENLIRETASFNSVKVIAEEMSVAALGSCKSLCKEVAGEIGVAHIFCDPDNSEREALGLPKIDDAETWGAREEHWLSRLQGADFPILFVCGANHVASFTDKCIARGIFVTVL